MESQVGKYEGGIETHAVINITFKAKLNSSYVLHASIDDFETKFLPYSLASGAFNDPRGEQVVRSNFNDISFILACSLNGQIINVTNYSDVLKQLNKSSFPTNKTKSGAAKVDDFYTKEFFVDFFNKFFGTLPEKGARPGGSWQGNFSSDVLNYEMVTVTNNFFSLDEDYAQISISGNAQESTLGCCAIEYNINGMLNMFPEMGLLHKASIRMTSIHDYKSTYDSKTFSDVEWEIAMANLETNNIT